MVVVAGVVVVVTGVVVVVAVVVVVGFVVVVVLELDVESNWQTELSSRTTGSASSRPSMTSGSMLINSEE